jgi:hypothetical protein
MIMFSCSSCQCDLEAPDHKASTKINCPECGKSIAVPATASQKRLPGVRRPADPGRFSRQEGEDTPRPQLFESFQPLKRKKRKKSSSLFAIKIIAGLIIIAAPFVAGWWYLQSHVLGGVALQASSSTTGSEGSKVSQMDLGPLFTKIGIFSDGNRFDKTAGMDGQGYGLSANVLTNVTYAGQPYLIGPTGANNVASAKNQTVAFPGLKPTSLTFLATAANGNQLRGQFVVSYTDGSKKEIRQSFSDWVKYQNHDGEAVAVTMPYRVKGDGGKDERPFFIFAYAIPPNSDKIIKSVLLPNNPDVAILALNVTEPAK